MYSYRLGGHGQLPRAHPCPQIASAEDIKLFISTVLRPVCKAVCLESKERELVRQMILKVSSSLVYCRIFSSMFNPRVVDGALDIWIRCMARM